MQDGDRNTRFYHRSTIIWRNRGRVKMLKIEGEWTSNSQIIERHVSNYFEKLFYRWQTEVDGSSEMPVGRKIEASQTSRFIRHASMDKVRKAVFGMKRFGSPGPDGIQAAFYQSYWDIVGCSVTNFVNEALATGKVPVVFLEAFISLIPKKESSKFASDFRPITLLDVVFKILSKVLVNRLRPLMDNIIGPFKNSFFLGRSTVDNTVLTQEIIHSMNRKRGKKGFMVLKLDLHKAYDSLDWDFLDATQTSKGFPRRLIDLIMFSLKESRISIHWNGGKLPQIGVGRGIRQGDPLAPYLFILARERLSDEIQHEVQKEKWKPFSLARGGTGVSHLFFADDLLLFSEASEQQINTIMACVKRFSALSDLSINLNKSLIYCLPNTCHRVAIGDLAMIPVTDNLGKYLGIPILHKRVNRDTFRYILDKMNKKLANWNVGTLSLVGRKILTQSALATISVYMMQSMAIPKGTCDDIDRICYRDFLWGDLQDRKKIHLVNWEEVCKPCNMGGLGLRRAVDFNDALL